VRNEKLVVPTAAVSASSSSSYSPKMLSGMNTSRPELISTPKSVLQTSHTQPVAIVTCSAKSFVSSYTTVTYTSVTKTVGCIVASANSKTEWQLEAERRAAARSGGYIDPEKHPRKSAFTTETSQQSQMPTAGLQSIVSPIASVTKQSTVRDALMTNNTKPCKLLEPQVKDSVLIGRQDRNVLDKTLLPVTSSMGVQVTDLVITSVAPDTSNTTMVFVRPQIVLPSQPSVVPHKITVRLFYVLYVFFIYACMTCNMYAKREPFDSNSSSYFGSRQFAKKCTDISGMNAISCASNLIIVNFKTIKLEMQVKLCLFFFQI